MSFYAARIFSSRRGLLPPRHNIQIHTAASCTQSAIIELPSNQRHTPNATPYAVLPTHAGPTTSSHNMTAHHEHIQVCYLKSRNIFISHYPFKFGGAEVRESSLFLFITFQVSLDITKWLRSSLPQKYNEDGNCHLGDNCPFQHKDREIAQEQLAVKKAQELMSAGSSSSGPPPFGRYGLSRAVP